MNMVPSLYLFFTRSGILRFVSVRIFFFQAEDGIRDLVRSRGLGDVYKRQGMTCEALHGEGND